MKVSALPADQQLNLTDRVLISDEGGTKTATIQQVMEAITSGSGGGVNLSLGADVKEVRLKYTFAYTAYNFYQNYSATAYLCGNLFFYSYPNITLTKYNSGGPKKYPKLSDLSPEFSKAYGIKIYANDDTSSTSYVTFSISGADAELPVGSVRNANVGALLCAGIAF